MSRELDGVAFVFPGQGSQQVGMGRDLYDAHEEVRRLFAEANEALGYDLTRIVLEGPEEELRLTANTQPAILLVSTALERRLAMTPQAVAGHSLGEYSALVAAGALELGDAVRLLHRRGTYMQEAVPPGQGAMRALIGADPETVEKALAAVGGDVDIANRNAPGQMVIAGETGAVRRAVEEIGARQSIELPVSAPFHCRLMRPAEERLAADLAGVSFRAPRVAFFNNVDAARVDEPEEIRDGLRRQVSRPVRWTEQIQRMIADEGIHTFVEIGPGNVLSGLIRRIDRSVRRLGVHDEQSLASVRAELGG